ncbi:MAG: hypothetical protein QOI47_674, partial [Actinomycetota bacterium]|nr:hypothetical protein [Actinomycetota bacterium]
GDGPISDEDVCLALQLRSEPDLLRLLDAA